MERKEAGRGITRIVLRPEDAPLSSPIAFADGDGGEAFLTLTAFESLPRPVFRLRGGGAGETRQTANGEVVSFAGGEKEESEQDQPAPSCRGEEVGERSSHPGQLVETEGKYLKVPLDQSFTF